MTTPVDTREIDRLRGLLESRALGFAGWDEAGRLTEANEAFASLLGHSRSDLLASAPRWQEITPADHQAARLAAIERAGRDGLTWDHPSEYLRKDGSRVAVLLAVSRMAPGTNAHAVLVIDDAERRSPERIRRSQWRLYREFLDAAPDLVVVRDAQSRIFWANRAFLAFHRTTQEAIMGQRMVPHRAVDAGEQELRGIARARETGEAVELPPESLLGPEGDRFFFYTSCQPLPDPTGLAMGTISVSRNATDRANAEQNLARSEAHLRRAQALAQIGSWEIRVANRHEDYWSEETFRILGLAPGQPPYSPDRYIDEIVHPDDRVLARTALTGILSSGSAAEGAPYRILRPDGSMRWVLSEAHLVLDAQGGVERIVGTIRDVTEQKQAEAIRLQLENRLRQAQKLEAVGTLAGGIAHDFNNILAALSGYAELVREATRDNPAAQSDVQQVLQAASRAASLVSRILTFSRQRDARRKSLLLEQPIREALQLLRVGVPPSITIAEAMDPATPAISGDETQMLQVMMNLGTNALHGMQERGGVLEVRLEPFAVSAEFAKLHPQLDPGPHARLSVSDQGIGIEAHLLDRVLEPFFTTKPPGFGTGLGLSVVHGIVLDHGGALEVDSVANVGTTVRVILPAQQTPAARAEAGTTSPRRGTGQRVLLVDDEPALAELGRRRLEELGYAAEVHTDARRALAAFRDAPWRFDLLVTDHAMPYLSGVDLARAVHAVRPDVPVLLVSGHGDAVERLDLAASGIRGHLSKPVDRRTLADAVAASLGDASS